MDCSPPGSPVHGILQARILDWFPFPYPGDLSNPEIAPKYPALQADSLPSKPPGKPLNMCSLLYVMYSQYGCKKLGPIGRISKELNSAQPKNGHLISHLLSVKMYCLEVHVRAGHVPCLKVVMLGWSALIS